MLFFKKRKKEESLDIFKQEYRNGRTIFVIEFSPLQSQTTV